MQPCHCGTAHPMPIPALAGRSTGAICVCSNCGTVYVPDRRPPGVTAAAWGKMFGAHYKPALPAIKARQFVVAESINQFVRHLQGKVVVDIGAGGGEFAHMLTKQYGARVTAVEPSATNVAHMNTLGLDAMTGTAETAQHILPGTADVVTALWTLENASDAAGFVTACRKVLKPDGVLVIATGSRIMVPFKKPLGMYIAPGIRADMNPWRLSRATTAVLLWNCGLQVTWENRWLDSDTMIVAAVPRYMPSPDEPAPGLEGEPPAGDNPHEVIDWFQRWATESARYEAADASPSNIREMAIKEFGEPLWRIGHG